MAQKKQFWDKIWKKYRSYPIPIFQKPSSIIFITSSSILGPAFHNFQIPILINFSHPIPQNQTSKANRNFPISKKNMNNSSSPSPSASTTILPTAKARPRAAPAVGKALGEGPGQDASHDALHRRLDAAEGRDQDQATHLDKTLEIWGKMVK